MSELDCKDLEYQIEEFSIHKESLELCDLSELKRIVYRYPRDGLWWKRVERT